MAMRLQEIHPSVVHFPLALLPLSIGADLLGRLTGNEALTDLGRRTMPLAAASAVVAAAAGLVAQEEVNAEGKAHDMLVTHRNLNLTMVGATAAMAAWRAKRDEPTTGYLALGLLGLATMTYTAYLGGHMVYEHGVGVLNAGGVRDDHSPEVKPGTISEAARVAGEDITHAVPRVAQEAREGDVLPFTA